jgi:hypothetical protein
MAKKNAAAVALGRRGGKKRAATLSAEELSNQGKKAATARWDQAKLQDAPAKDAGDKLDPSKKPARQRKIGK